MFNFIIRRLLYAIPIIIGIALITFLLFNVVGGDPVLQMVGKHATPQVIEELRAEMGLNRPLPMQFVDFLRQIVTFDYGRSYSSKRDVLGMMIQAAPVSFTLAFPGFIISLCLSISASLFVAFWRGTLVDRVFVVVSVLMISVPSLAYILFGQYFLAYKVGLFPISGFSFDPTQVFSYIALPVLIWVVLSFGGELRFYRTVMLDEINQDYIRTARSKGLNERVVMFKHVLKNAMIPIITSVLIQIPFLITGALLLESFFAIPGMGTQLIDAFNTSDLPMIKAQVMVFSILYVVFNILTDICYSLVDPRVTIK
ncbi:MAG: ABC transporter permease [Oligoflexia bacterium]|nr:ABC transporter permease [Oligoflexia bacterium]